MSRVRRAVEAALREKRLTIPESGRFMKRYEEALEGYTYLSLERLGARPAPGGTRGRSDSPDSPDPGGRHRGAARVRGHVPLQQPRARGRGVRGGRDRHRPAHLADLRARPRLPRGPAPHPPADREADRHERAHRAVLEGLPRADGALDRRRPRGGRAVLRDLARQPALGGGPGLAPRAASSTTTSPSGSGRRRASRAGCRVSSASTTGPAATRGRARRGRCSSELGTPGPAGPVRGRDRQRAGLRAGAPDGLRGRPARDPLHRHPRVPRQRGLQARDRRGRREGHRPHRAADRGAGRRDRHSLGPAAGTRRPARSPASCCAAAGPSTGCGRSTPCGPCGRSSAASCATRPSATSGRPERASPGSTGSSRPARSCVDSPRPGGPRLRPDPAAAWIEAVARSPLTDLWTILSCDLGHLDHQNLK